MSEESIRTIKSHWFNRIEAALMGYLRKQTAAMMKKAHIERTPGAKTTQASEGETLERDTSFRFLDRTGRKWDNATHLEALAHTLIGGIARDAYPNIRTAERHDLLPVSEQQGSSTHDPWSGKVLRITGNSRDHPAFVEAASGGLFHPWSWPGSDREFRPEWRRR